MAATSRKQQAWISRSDRWHVVLSETVIFVEGGGQPSDHGSVGSRGVLRVFWDAQGSLVRPLEQPVLWPADDLYALQVHELDGPLDVGASVSVVLDWEKRFDHMQVRSFSLLPVADRATNLRERATPQASEMLR